ncbi:mobilization protein MobC [Serratia marcescens]|uniref:mobilization protein MobC n=1 Tax=Serratia TaxID=613 RepID=UPI003B9E3CFF
MATKNQYSQEQVELAKVSLADLPDLSKERLSGKEVLDELKEQIILLATQKGYTAKDIKSALESCEIVVSERAINEIIKNTTSIKSGRKKKGQLKDKNTTEQQQM